jgi:hypothetical protein
MKVASTPLAFDDPSGKPYKHQPQPVLSSSTTAAGVGSKSSLSKEAEVVVMDGKVAKL